MTEKQPQTIAGYARADIELAFDKTLSDEQWKALVEYVNVDTPHKGEVGFEIATGIKHIDEIIEDNRQWLLRIEKLEKDKNAPIQSTT